MQEVNCSIIKQALTAHLVAQLDVSPLREMCIATLPLPTLDNRWVDVFIEPRATDFYLIHDGGKAVNELVLQGGRVTASVERDFGIIAQRFGIAFTDEMFQTGSKIGRLAETVNAVGMCSALAMTQLLETVNSEEQPLEAQLRTLLKRWSKGRARLSEHVKVKGELKQHEFDFTITPKKGPTIAISLLNPTAGALSAAERFGFKAQDLQNTEFRKWKRLAVEVKSEVWSQEARKIVDRFSHRVIQIPSGTPATYQELSDALEPIAS